VASGDNFPSLAGVHVLCLLIVLVLARRAPVWDDEAAPLAAESNGHIRHVLELTPDGGVRYWSQWPSPGGGTFEWSQTISLSAFLEAVDEEVPC
jgi:hypothetical protein